MKQASKLTTIALTATSLLLTACATGPAETKVLTRQVDKKNADVQAMLASQRTPVNNNIYSEQSWIPLRKLDVKEHKDTTSATDGIQIEINQTFANLNDVAGAITSLAGKPVFISADTQVTPATGSGLPGVAPPQFGPAAKDQAGPITSRSPFTANYSGTLTGFLNLATTYYGIFWKVEGTGLRFFMMDSKTYKIAALPGDSRLSSSVESSSNGSAGGTGGTQSGASSNSTGIAYTGLSVWVSLQESIRQMLTPGGKVIALPATGNIIVTDTPNVLKQVTAYINEQNKSLNRQVAVNVRVLSVELNDTDSYGINWDAVYANLASIGNPYSVALKTAFPSVTGAGNLIISAPLTGTKSGSSAVISSFISALSTQGRVSELTSATLVTMNNQAAPVNVGRRVSYLASSSITAATVAGGVPTVTLTPGTVQTGFSMTLVPHIIDDKEMLIQYSLDLSSLLQMKTISSGQSTIETPDVSTSNFIQRVRMQTGETLVVAGFDHDNLSAVANGIGSAQNQLMGQRNGTSKRSMLVVLIQPNLSL